MADNPTPDESGSGDPECSSSRYRARVYNAFNYAEKGGITVDVSEWGHEFIPSENIDTDTPPTCYWMGDRVEVEMNVAPEGDTSARLVEDKELRYHDVVRQKHINEKTLGELRDENKRLREEDRLANLIQSLTELEDLQLNGGERIDLEGGTKINLEFEVSD